MLTQQPKGRLWTKHEKKKKREKKYTQKKKQGNFISYKPY
jgi:hypothetical protein